MHELIPADGVTVAERSVTVRAHDDLRSAWLVDDFFVAYDDVDVGRLEPSVQLMPFLLNVAPVVWLSGKQYSLPELDATLALSLERVRRALAEMYPEIPWSGRIVPRRVVHVNFEADHGRVGVLFSGGLDSLCTALRNADARPCLISVQGNDIAFGNERGWSTVRSQTQDFAERHGFDTAYVKSNFKQFLDAHKLSRISPAIPNWWGHVQHGLGLAGLAAPVLRDRGAGRLLIGATHTADFEKPWGSHPTIDDEIAWGPVRTHHDSYDLSRQDKLRVVIDYYAARSLAPTPLRVCYAIPHGDGRNCCRCEKCLRTITGLLLEGESPRAYGFDVDAEEAIARTKQGFARVRFRVGEDEVFMWNDLKRRAEQTSSSPGTSLDAYVRWLQGLDIEAYHGKSLKKQQSLRSRLRRSLRRYPRVAGLLRRLAGRA